MDERTPIDAFTRASHQLLQPDDTVYYLGEYTPGAGYVTPTNDLIHNFKIKPSSLRRSPVRRRHKERAIREIAAALTHHFSSLPEGAIIVPIPTSKLPVDPDYDDRLLRTLKCCRADPALDVRELIKQKRSTAADHEARGRQRLRQLLANYYVDETLSRPRPSLVVLFDDVLTQGRHFKVCQRLLREHYAGEVPVVGFFIARRARAASMRFRLRKEGWLAHHPLEVRKADQRDCQGAQGAQLGASGPALVTPA